jgi:hypothetical protein
LFKKKERIIMKTKLYIGILALLPITCTTVLAQRDDMLSYRNDDAKVVVNNYYNDYDYYYSSRINRFHRTYSVFDYYAPVFTDSYWYDYQPYSWGISIYGIGGLGIGYYNNYPVYNYGYMYNNGWYDPFWGNSFYWDYNPFYYNAWYSPVMVNLNLHFGWRNNYYGHNHLYYSDWNSHRMNYNYSHYNPDRYSSVENLSHRRLGNYSGTSRGIVSGRESSSGRSSRNEYADLNNNRSHNDNQVGETKRRSSPAVNRDHESNYPNDGNSRSTVNIRNSESTGHNRSSINNNNVNNTGNGNANGSITRNINRNQDQNLNRNDSRNTERTINSSENRIHTPSNVRAYRAGAQQSSEKRSISAGLNQSRPIMAPERHFSSSRSGSIAAQKRTNPSGRDSKSAAVRSASHSSKEKSSGRK